MQALADGSSEQDAHPKVIIDLGDTLDRWRYLCPNKHRGEWEPTNGGLYCYKCSRLIDHAPDRSPQHKRLWDTKREEFVPWSAVEVLYP